MQLIKYIFFFIGGLALSLSVVSAEADVVAVVSSKSSVSTLSKNMVVDIFLGKTSRFPDGSRAIPVDQIEGSSDRDEFYNQYAGRSPEQIKAHWSKIIFTGRGQPPKEVTDSIKVKQRLVENPNAIGYIDENMLDDSVKVVLDI